jgi:tungstate transport system substrate-binding protein
MRAFVRALIVALAVLGCAPGHAQQGSVTVGAPAGLLSQLVRDLGELFAAQTGIAVRVEKYPSTTNGSADALVLPSRTSPAGAEQQTIFVGEGVLVGSRADRARVRGLRDIKKAFQWIAAARATYVSSSPSLGMRDLELKLWSEVGVNVRVRSTWYIEVTGDEDAVYRQAAQWGAYALVQRATWVAQENQRGLEIVAAGDPVLRTPYVSELLRPESREARAWHEWLSSEQGQAALANWTLNGIQVFTPANRESGSGQTPPRT